MTTFRLDLTSNALLLPSTLPPSLVVDNGALVESSGWKQRIGRAIIPGYARSQDAEVSKYFLNFFKEVVGEKKMVPSAQLRQVVRFAEEYLSRHYETGLISKEITHLERYVFATRVRLNDFQTPEDKENARQQIRSHSRNLVAKWEGLNFAARAEDQEAFWTSPDLVDFIFNTHLHRYIRHPDYNHRIEMLPVQKLRDGVLVEETEAHLKMNDQMTPWSQIRSLIQVEKATERMYSIQPDGEKQYWMYLDRGFIQHDRHDMEHMARFKKLEAAPATCKIQVVTSHVNPEKWISVDRFLQGARHTFFRVVIGENFHANHPDLPYQDGEVYSLGWGGPWVDLNFLQPMTAIEGQWYCPDSTEFFAEDLHITERNVTDEKVIQFFEAIKRRTLENNSFQIVASNCCTNGIGALREVGVLDIPTKQHMLPMIYEFIFPQSFRCYLDQIGGFIARYTPEIIQILVKKTAQFFCALIIAPIFLLLGAWRTKEPERRAVEEGMEGLNNRIKALFSNFCDLFDPDKLSFDLTLNVWRWQQRDAQEHPERSFFIQQS